MKKLGGFNLEPRSSRGIEYLTSPKLTSLHSIDIVFTFRHHGFSKAPLDSLNLATHVGDESSNVLKNRMKVAAVFDYDPTEAIFCDQIHSSCVHLVDHKEDGVACGGFGRVVPAADALLTGMANLAITILTADCLPIVLVDPIKRAVGVVHAGWKGSLGGIAAKALASTILRFGSDPADILVFIGPRISAQNYPVSIDLYQLFEKQPVFGFIDQGDRYHLDLEAINIYQLKAFGVLGNNIHSSGICTVTDQRCFSYRRDGAITGRMMALARIR